jgi:hypothetical protein
VALFRALDKLALAMHFTGLFKPFGRLVALLMSSDDRPAAEIANEKRRQEENF